MRMSDPGPKPLRARLFWVWIKWLQDLGGTYEYFGPDPTVGADVKPKRTGRRDPDKKPRTYSLSGAYHKDKRGVVTKVTTRLAWGLRPGE